MNLVNDDALERSAYENVMADRIDRRIRAKVIRRIVGEGGIGKIKAEGEGNRRFRPFASPQKSLLGFGALLAAGRMAPDLPAAALAAMVFALAGLLLARSKRHGTPQLSNRSRMPPADDVWPERSSTV